MCGDLFFAKKNKAIFFVNRGHSNNQITNFRGKLRLFTCKYLQIQSSKCSPCPPTQEITLFRIMRTPLTEAWGIYGWM